MPSKPPQSTAQKKRQRTATKLPGKIAKRFKLNKIKAREEDIEWGKLAPTNKSDQTEENPINVKPMLQIASKKQVIPRKKGENNRKSRERLRELILQDL